MDSRVDLERMMAESELWFVKLASKFLRAWEGGGLEYGNESGINGLQPQDEGAEMANASAPDGESIQSEEGGLMVSDRRESIF